MGVTEYRSDLIWTVLKKIPRTRFDSVLDLGCGDGTVLREVAKRVGAMRGEGMDLRVRPSSSDVVTLRRANFLSTEPGGMILISTPNRWRPKNLMRLLLCRRPYMMQANPGVPPEQHLGHHRECSQRELAGILRGYFPDPEWSIRFIRLTPRVVGSRLRWIVNLSVYFLGWLIWRPIFKSASQDHYVAIQRNNSMAARIAGGKDTGPVEVAARR